MKKAMLLFCVAASGGVAHGAGIRGGGASFPGHMAPIAPRALGAPLDFLSDTIGSGLGKDLGAGLASSLGLGDIVGTCECAHGTGPLGTCSESSIFAGNGGFASDCSKHIGDKGACEGQKNLVGKSFCKFKPSEVSETVKKVLQDLDPRNWGKALEGLLKDGADPLGLGKALEGLLGEAKQGKLADLGKELEGLLYCTVLKNTSDGHVRAPPQQRAPAHQQLTSAKSFCNMILRARTSQQSWWLPAAS